MATVICMCGLPRSGKSTVARELSRDLAAPLVNQDSIRLAMHGQVYQKLAEPLTRAIKKIMTHALVLAGHDYVIVDETHWSREARDFIRDGPWQTQFYLVDTSPDICKQRAIDTGHVWLPPVIDEMMSRHAPLDEDEPRW